MKYLKYWITAACLIFLLSLLSFGLLYPIALWVSRRTGLSDRAIVNYYIIASVVVSVVLGLLLDFIYQRRRKARKNPS